MSGDTPTLSIRDNRGQTVRELQINRTEVDGERDIRITRHTYTPTGHLRSSIDPRFFTEKEGLFDQNPDLFPF